MRVENTKLRSTSYLVYDPQPPRGFPTWTLLAPSIACPHISCLGRPGTFARNGGFRSVQLAEHQHGRRQRRWSLVRTLPPPVYRLSGTNALQRKQRKPGPTDLAAPEQRRTLRRLPAAPAATAATVGRPLWRDVWRRSETLDPRCNGRRTLRRIRCTVEPA